MIRRIFLFGLIAALLFAAAYYGSPFLALQSLRSAIRSGNQARIEQLVDFPSVRGHLKADLKAQLVAKMEAEPSLKGNIIGRLGLSLAPSLVDQLVDGMVTPSGIATIGELSAWMPSLKLPSLGNPPAAPSPPQPAPGGSPTVPPAVPSDKPVAHYTYLSRDLFRVSETTTTRVLPAWVFQRQGLFGWRLIRIELPPGYFDRNNTQEPAAPEAVKP
jgi:hypothetical protein